MSANSFLTRIIPLFTVLFSTVAIAQNDVNVNSIAQLKTAISNAQKGDRIILANGSYNSSNVIEVKNKKGTSAQPIIIRAKSIGGVTITGNAGFNLTGSTEYVVIKGFVFKHKAQTGTYNSASRCTFQQNVYECTKNGTASSSYLKIFGAHNEVCYNTFQNKDFVGPILSIQGLQAGEMSEGNWVHHNHFKEFKNFNKNDCAAVQPGYGSRKFGKAYLIVEFNLFEKCNADAEGVASVKCSNTIFRYNTIRNSKDLSLRQGSDSEVYGNYFFGGSGVRFNGNDHRVYNNTFVNVNIAVKSFSRKDNTKPTGYSHDKANRCFVGFNTMINCTNGFWQDGDGGSSQTKLVNNIFYGCNVAAKRTRANWDNPTLKSNIIWDSPQGQLPSSAYTNQNPQFNFDGQGVPSLKSNSPAIGNATGSYGFVTDDSHGDARSGAKDIGADEFSTGTKIRGVLTASDVGVDGFSIGIVVNEPPIGAFSAPVEMSFDEGYQELYVLVTASDPDGDNISTVLFIDDVEIRAENAAPYEWGVQGSANENETLNLLGGLHTLKVIITDSKGATTTINKSLTINVPQGPYFGQAAVLPGVIEAEHFDVGGAEIAYYDNDSENKGADRSDFRTTEGVDIDNGNGGHVIGWTVDGEWLEYTVDVTESGDFDFDFVVSSLNGGGELRLLLDGQGLLNNVVIPQTNDWGTFVNVSRSLSLTAGAHVLRIEIVKKGFNLDKVLATKAVVTSIESLGSFDNSIYPNPSTGVFSLKNVAHWDVFDLLGNNIISGNDSRVDLSEFTSGAYVILVNGDYQRIILE